MSDLFRWLRALLFALFVMAAMLFSDDSPRWATTVMPILAFYIVYYGTDKP
jgi:hypothetical protein